MLSMGILLEEKITKKNLRLKRLEQTDTKCTFTNEVIIFSKMSRLTLIPTQPPIQLVQQVMDNHFHGTQIAVNDLHILGPLKEYPAEKRSAAHTNVKQTITSWLQKIKQIFLFLVTESSKSQ
jgi:hypothetical protein